MSSNTSQINAGLPDAGLKNITPLHLAAHRGSGRLISLLLNAKADPDKRVIINHACEMYAALKTCRDNIMMEERPELLWGGCCEAYNLGFVARGSGKVWITPLHVAAREGNAEGIRALLLGKANVNCSLEVLLAKMF